MVNTSIMEQHTDNPDSVFLNPDYLEKINQVPEVTDDEFRQFILTHPTDIPSDLKQHIDEYMANPINRTSSKVLGWVKDWIEHPERSSFYRDRIIFNTPSKEMDSMTDGDSGAKWSFEIPLFSIDF